jgi:hypothetical protein
MISFNLIKLILFKCTLKALSVDDGITSLIVLRSLDPHVLETWQAGKEGTSDPNRILSFFWSDNIDPDTR